MLAVLTLCGALSLGLLFCWRWLWPRGREGRSLPDLLTHFVALRLVCAAGRWGRRGLDSDTRGVRRAQDDTLSRRTGASDRVAFRELHPLTRRGGHWPGVTSLAPGELNVPASGGHGARTPGSDTGDRTLGAKAIAKEFFLQGYTVCMDSMLQAYPRAWSLQKTAKFSYASERGGSESWISAEGLDSSPPWVSELPRALYTTPPAARGIETEPEALYVRLLFALKDRKLGRLQANSAATVCSCFARLREDWPRLVEDVRLGRLSPELDLPPRVRRGLEAGLRPDARRADELSAEFESGFDGIARRVWPELRLLMAADSGSHQAYGDLLRQTYCRGLPVYSPVYATEEGLIGVNLWPERKERFYLLCPRSMFCEFIPVDLCAEGQPRTLFMDEVTEGELYELVITNASGLYRYRLGDVIKVVEFYNQCPVVEFKYRLDQTLNVRGEKISEEAFYRALQNAVRMWPGVVLLDYCCAESGLLGPNCGSSDPHYQVFIEVKGARNLTEDQRYKLDQCLQEGSSVYKSFRRKGSVGPARVHLVARGGFQELRRSLARGSDPFTVDHVLGQRALVACVQRKVVS